MQSPLSNFLLRPRSSRYRHRRSCSSPSSLLKFEPTSEDGTHDQECDIGAAPTLDERASNVNFLVPDSASISPAHFGTTGRRRSFESPFPSPFSLNVPLSMTGTYLCTLTLSNQASSLALFGGLLYAGLESGDVLVLKTPRLAECASFGIGSLTVKVLLVTENTIFSAHKDHKIRVWRRPDTEGLQYKLLQTLPTAADYLRNLLLNKKYIQIRRHHRRLWIQHVDTISAMALDSSGILLYSASWDRTFKVWNLRSMRCMQSIKAHEDAINAIVVSSGPDGLIYTAAADHTVKVWKKLSEKKVVQVARLDQHTASVNTLVLREDTGILYSGGSDCCIHVWQRAQSLKFSWKLTTTLRGHRMPVLSLAAAGSLLCSGAADKAIRVWRRGTLGAYTCIGILQGHGGPVKSVAVSVTSLRSCVIYSASLDCTTKVWSVLFDREDHDDQEASPQEVFEKFRL